MLIMFCTKLEHWENGIKSASHIALVLNPNLKALSFPIGPKLAM